MALQVLSPIGPQLPKRKRQKIDTFTQNITDEKKPCAKRLIRLGLDPRTFSALILTIVNEM
jgi:hypothetical protein